MVTQTGLLLGLLVFSVAVTLVTDWLVVKSAHSASTPVPRLWSLAMLWRVVPDLLWILLLLVAGLIAARYIQRIRSNFVGWAGFGVLACSISLLRAWLHQHTSTGMSHMRPIASRLPWRMARAGLQTLTYLLFAIVLYLTLSLVTQQAVAPALLLPLSLGALLPDLDSQTALLGRILPFVSRPLESRYGHRGAWHSLLGVAGASLLAAPLSLLFGLLGWLLVPLGFLSHLGLDVLEPPGLMLLWPWRSTRYYLGRTATASEAYRSEPQRWLFAPLALAAILLLLAVDVGPAAPKPTPAPSYDQSLQRYSELRGRNIAFADVRGTWQSTGRRVAARFEILNAKGGSFVLLDRYTGQVFTAGPFGGTDHLYVDRIDVFPGAPVSIKAVELHLENQTLGESLAALYEMQREPGLEHIFVSGDVVLSASENATEPSLQPDLSQTTVRKIEAGAEEHFHLQYLTASELIALASISVAAGDLVVVATYSVPPSGPTVTPLPTLPVTPQATGADEESAIGEP